MISYAFILFVAAVTMTAKGQSETDQPCSLISDDREPNRYAGCDRHVDSFSSYQECVHTCGCSLSADPGPCKAYFPMYYFNSTTETCEQFIYGGCGGNANRFETRSKCTSTCVCSQPKDVGPCEALIPSYYFDTTTNKCQAFDYGGCGGNPNRFDSQEACTDRCVCSLDSDTGPCRAGFTKYFYNATTGACEGFIYGGCKGNGNRFNTPGDCKEVCRAYARP